MKNIFKILIVLLLALNAQSFVFAEETILQESVDLLLNENTEEVIVQEEILKSKANVFIRASENVIFDGEIEFETDGIKNVTDSNGVVHEVSKNSVLGILVALDEQSDLFNINDIAFYPAFNAFYLRCITPLNKDALCDNWQYVINGNTPWQGIDALGVSDGDKIALYFGFPRQVSIEKETFLPEEEIKVSAQKYNYLNDTWEILSDVSVGIIQDNPADPWSPIIISEQPVDDAGQSIFVINNFGNYKIGIKEDYYFPTKSISVVEKVEFSGGGSGGGGGEIISHNIIDIPRAIAFLQNLQKSDGSFGDDLYTDWVAIGLGRAPNVDLSGLKNFLLNDKLDSTMLTDYERRAMALMALGLSPYNGTEVNYIEKINNTFDGNQFGDTNLYNDDVFALIVLSRTEQNLSDEKFIKTVNFILSKQKSDGGFDGPDITSAVVTALSKFTNIAGVENSISKARNYLKSTQTIQGGWENTFATSWVMSSLKIFGENPNDWEKNNKNPNDYLFTFQKADGGLEDLDKTSEYRIWATAYAIPGALNLSWHDILNDFSKPILVNNQSQNDNNLVNGLPENNNPVLKTDLPPVIEENKPNEVLAISNTESDLAEVKPQTSLPVSLKKDVALVQQKGVENQPKPEIITEKIQNISQTAQVSQLEIPEKKYYLFGALALLIICFAVFKFLKK